MEELPRLLNVTGLLPIYPPGTAEEDIPRVDLVPIKHLDLRLCVGKEWHRFPGHYLVPNGIRVDFVKSDFSGLLPRHFIEGTAGNSSESSRWWLRPQTRYVPNDLNDLNKEEMSHYVRLTYTLQNFTH